MSMSLPDEWKRIAEKEVKGDPIALVRKAPEGIEVKPIYTAPDLDGIEHLDTLPGMSPFVRGPKATMYTGRPWTVRQYAGFSTAEAQTHSIVPSSPQDRRACRLHSIWRPTAAMILIILAS